MKALLDREVLILFADEDITYFIGLMQHLASYYIPLNSIQIGIHGFLEYFKT